jgi:predicted ester cyclase
MSQHSSNKRLIARFLQDMASGDTRQVLADCCHADCRWEIFHPFNSIIGLKEVADQFWLPLRAAFPDYEQRIAFVIGGDYEGRTQVSTWGHLMGTFERPWLGIPPTRGLTSLRFGCNAIVRDGKLSKVYILLDIVDVMLQAGYYPFRPMPGSAEQWSFPPCDTGATGLTCDPVRGAETLRIVREMQVGLPKPEEIATLATRPVRHSPHWHANMNWYGPAGIGSMRGQRGFRDYHGALFLQAFPDRHGVVRDGNVAEDAPGHYVRLGDGLYSVTGGWPSLYGTHLGGEWLGLPPSGRKVEMRVADWYRLDNDNKIVDNWVMMDIPHIVNQMGLDIFHDLKFRVERATPRWPEVR